MSGIAGLVVIGSLLGLFEKLELSTLDCFFRWRSLESPDPRITIVTIGESDIRKLGHWPVTDAELAKAIVNIRNKKPLAIGLDIYRNLAVEPGHQELLEVYQSTPNLVAIEKIVGEKVDPPAILRDLDRLALSDMVLDADGKLRRSLISVESDSGELKLSLGVKLALMYLQEKGIKLEQIDSNQQEYRLGKAIFNPLKSNSGGYIRADTGGYQILLNFRGTEANFSTISLIDVLENNIPESLMRDRIVAIGPTAESLNDFVQTPYTTNSLNQTPGVVIHANVASQILSAAIDGRSLLKVWQEPVEWLWIWGWSGIGTIIGWISLKSSLFRQNKVPRWQVFSFWIILGEGSLIGISYLIFWAGWWIPVISPVLALTASALAIAFEQNRELQKLAFTDSLTQVANRRYFDRYFEREWNSEKKEKHYLSLILCDIDLFKLYNDTYGHQTGDRCLQQVAKGISKAIRKNDIVARYGGEEFAIILPHTQTAEAICVAQRMLDRVESLKIPHAKSSASNYVTISCGVASIVPDVEVSPTELISMADRALYLAKERGRARFVVFSQENDR